MSAMAETKKRLTVSRTDMEAVGAALAFAASHADAVSKAFPGKHYPTGRFVRLEGVVEELLKQKQLLLWRPVESYWEATLGTAEDGVTFTIQYRETCYRRGRWLLQIKVHGGPHHEEWGCFDDADKPERDYHDVTNLVAEAEAVAAVLLADRMERGPIEGWVPDAKTT